MHQTFKPQEIEKVEAGSPVQAEVTKGDLQTTPTATWIAGAHRQAVKWRRGRRNALTFCGSLFSLSFVSLFLLALLPHRGAFPSAYLSIVMLTLILSLFGLLVTVLMRPLRNNTINRLWDSVDVAAVGPLLECTQMLLPEMSFKANASLMRLLPRMQADDLTELTDYQRHCLRRLIDVSAVQEPSYENMTLEGIPALYVEATRQRFHQLAHERKEAALAVLRVLEQSDSELDLITVKKLAAGKGIAAGDGEILAAAGRCQEILQARMTRQRGSETFLRASNAPPTSGDTLLRPAAGTGDTGEKYLLRPDS